MPINLAFLQNGTYNQIIANVEVDFELSGLETDGELPNLTMETTKTTVNKQTQPRNAEQQQFICRYSKKPENAIRDSRKNIRKEQNWQGVNETSCPHWQRNNHTTDMCWSCLSAANRPKKDKIENPNDSADESHKSGTSAQISSTSIIENTSN